MASKNYNFYKIYIPTVHLETIKKEILKDISSYTLIEANGIWKGESEKITIFEYIVFNNFYNEGLDFVVAIVDKLFELKEQAVLLFNYNEPFLYNKDSWNELKNG